jgi:hypothetical protein
LPKVWVTGIIKEKFRNQEDWHMDSFGTRTPAKIRLVGEKQISERAESDFSVEFHDLYEKLKPEGDVQYEIKCSFDPDDSGLLWEASNMFVEYKLAEALKNKNDKAGRPTEEPKNEKDDTGKTAEESEKGKDVVENISLLPKGLIGKDGSLDEFPTEFIECLEKLEEKNYVKLNKHLVQPESDKVLSIGLSRTNGGYKNNFLFNNGWYEIYVAQRLEKSIKEKFSQLSYTIATGIQTTINDAKTKEIDILLSITKNEKTTVYIFEVKTSKYNLNSLKKMSDDMDKFAERMALFGFELENSCFVLLDKEDQPVDFEKVADGRFKVRDNNTVCCWLEDSINAL